ncbi:MAG: hypothetical protein GWO10_00810 [candidate division Zixibacteria bacterium]|nr:hypothetical protein [Phycisphaerae bacterium]NIR62350.1 hypothetical protein [candidate division Zixibacteria bacterium]NIW97257.1 hypothetical protein [Phycisphaerae bacterium]
MMFFSWAVANCGKYDKINSETEKAIRATWDAYVKIHGSRLAGKLALRYLGENR